MHVEFTTLPPINCIRLLVGTFQVYIKYRYEREMKTKIFKIFKKYA